MPLTHVQGWVREVLRGTVGRAGPALSSIAPLVLGLALTSCASPGAQRRVSDREERSIAVQQNYDPFQGKTTYQLPVTDISARPLVAPADLGFGATIQTSDSAGVAPVAAVHFWATKPLNSRYFTA